MNIIHEGIPGLRAEAIDISDIDAARGAAVRSGLRLVDVLDEKLALPPELFIARLGTTLHLPVLEVEDLKSALPAFDILPFHECSEHGCILLRGDPDGVLEDAGPHEGAPRERSHPRGQFLWLATDDPFSADQKTWAEERIAEPFSWCIVHHGDLVALLASHEETLRALDTVAAQTATAGEEAGGVEDLSLKAISEESSEVVRLVRSTLRDAIMIGASDIHLETVAAGLAIKFRIDGILSQVKFIQDPRQAEQAISRVKVLAELDITERRIPQDGRFKAIDRGRSVDFRVSIMPSIHGEDAVLRILDKQSLYENTHQQLTLEGLGFEPADIRILRRVAHEPYGMLLVTGPTGSGKTTTLYAAITEINHGQDKIVTIEDPVEYQLPGVLQIPVNEKKGLTFARGLRSILRHDPDRIMVGEIRDAETANIAVQSALTGHLVFTTVHANNAFDVIGRFMNMDVDVYSLVSALNAILAQRLVRMVCNHCAAEHHPSAELLEDSGLSADEAKGFHFRIGRGCRECRGSGYKGRKAVAELLILNDELRELITVRAPLRQLKEAARKNGTRFLREAAFDAVRNGQTTLEEINRVTFVS